MFFATSVRKRPVSHCDVTAVEEMIITTILSWSLDVPFGSVRFVRAPPSPIRSAFTRLRRRGSRRGRRAAAHVGRGRRGATAGEQTTSLRRPLHCGGAAAAADRCRPPSTCCRSTTVPVAHSFSSSAEWSACAQFTTGAVGVRVFSDTCSVKPAASFRVCRPTHRLRSSSVCNVYARRSVTFRPCAWTCTRARARLCVCVVFSPLAAAARATMMCTSEAIRSSYVSWTDRLVVESFSFGGKCDRRFVFPSL